MTHDNALQCTPMMFLQEESRYQFLKHNIIFASSHEYSTVIESCMYVLSNLGLRKTLFVIATTRIDLRSAQEPHCNYYHPLESAVTRCTRVIQHGIYYI